MNSKKCLILIFMVCLSLPVFAISADALVQKAMENSVAMKTLEINRENNELSLRTKDEKDTLSVSVSSGEVSFQKESPGKSFFSMGPSAEIIISKKEDESVTFGLSNATRISKSGDTSLTVTPSAGYKKIINLDSFKDSRKALTEKLGVIRQDLDYNKRILQMKNGVLQNLISIIQSAFSIHEASLSYERLLLDYNTALASGELTEGSLNDLQSRLNLESGKVSLDSAVSKLSKLKESFRENYGIDYEEVSEIREAKLTLTEQPEGNSSVQIAEISLEIANQAVSAAEGTKKEFQIGANTKTPLTLTNGSDFNFNADASVFVALKGQNYSLNASAGTLYQGGEFSPFVTVTGNWANRQNTNTDALTLQTLKNNVLLAQIDYDNALSTYISDIKELETDIRDYRTNLEQFRVRSHYNTLILERATEMYGQGLVTKRELEDAELNVKKDEMQRKVYALQALIIENNISAVQL